MKNIKNWVLSPTPPTSTDVGWIKPVDGEYKLFVRSGSGKFVPCASSTVSTDTVQQLVLDSLSYGVSWKPGAADPALTRVGNMQLHRDLPIQNGMKGCVVQCKDGVNIQYYLHPNDWRFKKDGRITSKSSLTVDADNITTYQLVLDVFSTLQYESQYIRLTSTIDSSKEYICKVKSIDTSTKTATLEVPDDMPKTSSELTAISPFSVELGSVLNGYDGEVMVEVPEFWIRSWDTDTQKEVRVPTFKIDDSWEHQPKVLIAPYRDTMLNTVPENMGYISTLPVNSLVSICNTHTYCRGGSSSATSIYDVNLGIDPFYSCLGKPMGGLDWSTFSKYASLGGKKMIYYSEYKNILYWLYIIEYANFDCMLPYNAELTSEGFHQGGLGDGVWSATKSFYFFFTPCGYTNEIGNNTGIKEGYSPNYETKYIPRWHGIENPFGDGAICVEGTTGKSASSENNYYSYAIYRTDISPEKYIGMQLPESSKLYYVKEYKLGDSAEIMFSETTDDENRKYKCNSIENNYGHYSISFGHPKSITNGIGMNNTEHSLCSIRYIATIYPVYGDMGTRTSIVVPD